MKRLYLITRYITGAILAAFALASCTQPYLAHPTLFSRLPEYQPGAVPTQPRPLSEAEKWRYAEIDRQVMQQQEAAIAAQQAWQMYYLYPAPVTFYDSWWGWGCCRGWSWGYYSPGWWWNW